MGTSSEDTSCGKSADIPEVAIIVLNWNNYQDTVACLSSLEDIKYPNYRTIVVDNGSTDGSGERLAEKFGWCEFIFNEENLGFSGGCNTGIKHAISKNADYVLLLNNDTRVEQDFLNPLIETAESGRKRIVSGVIHEAGSDCIWYAGGVITPWKAALSHQRSVIDNEEYKTEFITGALMLLPVEFIEEYGMLNSDYFFGYEDMDLSYQARKMGWELMVNPHSRIEHDVSGSVGQKSEFRCYHRNRNKVQFALTNLAYLPTILFMIFFPLSRIKRYCYWICTQEIGLIYASVLGIYDSIKNKEFKYSGYFE